MKRRRCPRGSDWSKIFHIKVTLGYFTMLNKIQKYLYLERDVTICQCIENMLQIQNANAIQPTIDKFFFFNQ